MMRRLACLCLVLVLSALAGPGRTAALPDDQEPGARTQLRPEDLPPPYVTSSAGNGPEKVARPPGAVPRVPPGFTATLFAEGLAHPRNLLVAPDGAVFVAQQNAGEVTVLRDADGDGVAEQRHTFSRGFENPYGLALQGGSLYVADTRAVWRLRRRDGATTAEGVPERVTPPGALGSGQGHATRNLAFAPDGGSFVVAIGSADNLDEEPAPRATIQAFAADGTPLGTVAAGLRNPVGLAFHPGTGVLFTVVNERDGLGDGLVPDYLTSVESGGFYGWPFSYIGAHPQPGFAERRPDLVARTIVPDLLFKAHSAPLGLTFYTGGQFPPAYRDGAFVALHGSWNRRDPTGYTVAWVPFQNGRPAGFYETFASGFRLSGTSRRARVWGRPAAVAVAKDGSLLIADDVGGTVWRVNYSER